MPVSPIQKFNEYGLIDNQEVQLLSVLKEVMTSGYYGEIDITVGFLFLSGLHSIVDEMDEFFQNGGKMRIVMGSITNKETYEVLASMYHSLEDLKEELSRRTFSNSGVEKEMDTYAKTLGVMEQNAKNEEYIKKLREWIEGGNLEVRVYTKEFMHAKAYLFKPKESAVSPIGSVGSSNFSLAGLWGNTELNSIVTSTHFANLEKWFEKIWNASEDFNPKLLEIIASCWASQTPGNFPKPYFALMRGLMELYPQVDKGEKGLLMPTALEKLYDFQKDAVKRAISTINRYGGVLISDVVGLGKSYIGLALLEHFSLMEMFETGRSKIAIIAPPKLVPMWEGYLRMFKLNGKVFSAGLLLSGVIREGSKIRLSPKVAEMQEYLNSVGIVLVDEAHKFSNPNSNSYGNLQVLLSNKKVILLTATPYRKSFRDIVHQIQLFMPGEHHKFPISPTKWSQVIKMVENGLLDPSYILREIMVRRTRRDIIKYYGKSKEENCIYKGKEKECFPKRVLKTVGYNISSIYSIKGIEDSVLKEIVRYSDGTYFNSKSPGDYKNIYELLVAGIRTMLYTRYDLYRYVKENVKNKVEYQNLKHAGINLRGIMKTHYLKRLESSSHAFYISLKKSLAITESFLKFVERGYLPIGEEFDDVLYVDDDNPRPLTDEEIEKIVEEFGKDETSPLRKYKIGNFKVVELKQNLKFDIEKMRGMLYIVERVHKNVIQEPWKDEKLRTLANVIDQILYKEKERKILVFSEFEDTVKWIYNGLKKMIEEGKVEHPELWRDKLDYASSGKNVEYIASRFSPKSMSKTSVMAHQISEEEELDILITTDVMSEGMNLQDANYVVNYDIHWTPYKLIQRIGRIDRIGSKHEVINVINFLPETGLEKNLKLIDKVKARAEEFATALGEDGKIVTEEDKVNLSAMEAIYGGKVEDIEKLAEKSVISITTSAETALEKFIDEHPNDYENLKNIMSIRSAVGVESPKTIAFIVCSDGITPQYYTYEYFDGEWKREYISLDYFIRDDISYDTPPLQECDMDMYREVLNIALKDYKDMLRSKEGVKGKKVNIKSKNVKDFIGRLKRISRSINKPKSTRELAAIYYDVLNWGYKNITPFRKSINDIAKKGSWRRMKDEEFLEDVKYLLDMYSIFSRKNDAEKVLTEKGENYLKPHITAALIVKGKSKK